MSIKSTVMMTRRELEEAVRTAINEQMNELSDRQLALIYEEICNDPYRNFMVVRNPPIGGDDQSH